MSLPLSVSLPLERIERSIASIRRIDGETERLRVEIGEIVVNMTLTLDKMMNHVFKKIGNLEGGKPHIYFPLCDTKERLLARLQKDKMANMADAYPVLYATVVSAQSFGPGNPTWWKTLYNISSQRHEDHPEIDEVPTRGFTIKVGNDTVDFKGLELRVDGKLIQPSKVEVVRPSGIMTPVDWRDMKSEILRDANQDPVEFVSSCLQEIKRLCREMNDNLP